AARLNGGSRLRKRSGANVDVGANVRAAASTLAPVRTANLRVTVPSTPRWGDHPDGVASSARGGFAAEKNTENRRAGVGAVLSSACAQWPGDVRLALTSGHSGGIGGPPQRGRMRYYAVFPLAGRDEKRWLPSR